MIEARDLTKRYGPTVAVDALSFDVRPGSGVGAAAQYWRTHERTQKKPAQRQEKRDEARAAAVA